MKKTYTSRFGNNQVHALKGVTFSVEKGEYLAIMRESGSGKTMLLNILAALDKPTSGEVLLDRKEFDRIRENELAAFRRDNLGFVFQDFNLLETFSIKDDILFPLVFSGESVTEINKRLSPIEQPLRFSNILNKYPYEVSKNMVLVITFFLLLFKHIQTQV